MNENQPITAMKDIDSMNENLAELVSTAESALAETELQSHREEIIEDLLGNCTQFQNNFPKQVEMKDIEESCRLAREYGSIRQAIRFEFICIRDLINHQKFDKAFDFLIDITAKVKEQNDINLASMLDYLIGTVLTRLDREEEAEPYIQRALDFYESSDDRSQLMRTLILKLSYEWLKGNYVQCRKVAQRLVEEFQDVMRPQQIADTYGRLGNICNRQGDNDMAIDSLSKARDISEKYGLQQTLGGNLLTLGNVYMDSNTIDLAMDCYQKAAEVYEKMGGKGGYASSLNNIGLVYMQRGDNEKARETYEKALGVYLQAGLKRETVPLLNNLAVVCQHLRQIDKAVDYVRLSYDTALELDNKYETIETIIVMSYMLAEDAHNRGDIDAFPWIEERLEEARKLIEEIEAKKLHLWYMQAHADVLDSKALTYVSLNEPMKAYETLKESSDNLRELIGMHGKIAQENMAKKVEEVTAQLELKMQRKESEELKKINNDLKIANTLLMQQGNEMIDLERRNSALAMAVTANHEINQPLMVIQGNLELLVASLSQNSLSEKEKTYLKRLNNAVERISKILERYRESNKYVFDFYSPDTKMVTLDKETKEKV